VVAGPFYPAGRGSKWAALRGRLDECLMGLCRTLSDDWPKGFLQVGHRALRLVGVSGWGGASGGRRHACRQAGGRLGDPVLAGRG
jgi:hypothetical protein